MPIKTYKPRDRVGTFSLCIYGKSGTGKTTLVGTMPGPGLIIDVPQVEGGTFVLDRDDIDVVEVREWKEINEIYRALLRKDKRELPNVEKYKWVCIDSATGMQELAMHKVVKERPEEIDPNDVTMRDWGKIGRHMVDLFYRFRKLPYTIIWIAQERKFGDNDEPTMIGPGVSPAALAGLMPSQTLVGRLWVSGSKRLLRVQPHTLYWAKSRGRPGRKLPSVIDSPNLGEILRYLVGNGERPKAAKTSSVVVE